MSGESKLDYLTVFIEVYHFSSINLEGNVDSALKGEIEKINVKITEKEEFTEEDKELLKKFVNSKFDNNDDIQKKVSNIANGTSFFYRWFPKPPTQRVNNNNNNNEDEDEDEDESASNECFPKYEKQIMFQINSQFDDIEQKQKKQNCFVIETFISIIVNQFRQFIYADNELIKTTNRKGDIFLQKMSNLKDFRYDFWYLLITNDDDDDTQNNQHQLISILEEELITRLPETQPPQIINYNNDNKETQKNDVSLNVETPQSNNVNNKGAKINRLGLILRSKFKNFNDEVKKFDENEWKRILKFAAKLRAKLNIIEIKFRLSNLFVNDNHHHSNPTIRHLLSKYRSKHFNNDFNLFTNRYKSSTIDDNDDDNKSKLFLVTNRHVLIGDKKILPVRFTLTFKYYQSHDGQPGGVLPFVFECAEGKNVFFSQKYDIGIIDMSSLELQSDSFKISNLRYVAFCAADLPPANTFFATSPIYMTGYPKKLCYKKTRTPITRNGTLTASFVENWDNDQNFLINMPVFNGSSGSPVYAINTTHEFGQFTFNDDGEEDDHRPRNRNRERNEEKKIYLLGIFYRGVLYKVKGGANGKPIQIPMGLGITIKAAAIDDFITITQSNQYVFLDMEKIDHSEDSFSMNFDDDYNDYIVVGDNDHQA